MKGNGRINGGVVLQFVQYIKRLVNIISFGISLCRVDINLSLWLVLAVNGLGNHALEGYNKPPEIVVVMNGKVVLWRPDHDECLHGFLHQGNPVVSRQLLTLKIGFIVQVP